MQHVSPDQIEEYFSRYSWSYTRSSEDTWITGVRTSVSSFRIFVRISEHWVYFVINPFVVAPPEQEARLRFYYHVLRMNLDMNMAKFGLDSDGDLFLAVELPTENFVYSHFADALNGISHHAERLYSEVFNLAHNASIITGRYDDELDVEDLPENGHEKSTLPMDDQDLPEELINDSNISGPIIAGKEVRIVDDGDGMRIEFETAHDLDEEESGGSKSSAEDAVADEQNDATASNSPKKDVSSSHQPPPDVDGHEGSGPSQQDSDEHDS